MNLICSTHRVTPPSRRDVWRLLLAVLLPLGVAAACTPGGADSDEQDRARLTAGDAVQLLGGFTSPESGSRGLELLTRPAPTGPPPEEVTVDSLGVDFGTFEAPLRMIEFFDYGCGYCRLFHQDTRGPLHDEYVDPGQVFWKSIPFIIGSWPASVPVSLAAECARDQGRGYFEEISTLIFEHQSDWKVASAPGDLAEAYAEEVGLDMQRYRTCFENDELLWRVQAHTRFADALGVRGTPTFLLVGWGPISGALPLETFRQVIDRALTGADAEQP
jgi:protein-disulfide isomerase